MADASETLMVRLALPQRSVHNYRHGGAFMANEEHVRILRSGVKEWNEWRETNPMVIPDLVEANLEGENLNSANLERAHLNGAKLMNAELVKARLSNSFLSEADLTAAELIDANLGLAGLSKATLTGANLRSARMFRTDLSDANMSEADLDQIYFFMTNLSGTDFSRAQLAQCLFLDTSLARIKGISDIIHRHLSHINVRTLEITAADLTEDSADQYGIDIFLEGAGVAKEYIEFFRSRIGRPIRFYSAFISYSTKDQAFSDRLYADLRQQGIRCWRDKEDLKIGDKFRRRINDAIRIHDKLLVVLSQDSVKSAWVEDEVEAAFERECRDGNTVLFPIRLDDAVMDSDEAWAASIRRTRHIGDFRKWKNHNEYQKSLARLIRDLQADDKTKPAST